MEMSGQLGALFARYPLDRFKGHIHYFTVYAKCLHYLSLCTSLLIGTCQKDSSMEPSKQVAKFQPP